MEGDARSTRPRIWRLQFSLATVFVLTTVSAVAVWFWYQRPFEVENKQYGSDPFAAGPAASSTLLRREVETVRRVWGGKTVRHGPRRVYDASDNLLISENYRNGQEDGEFVEYDGAGNKRSLVTYVRGALHGPARRWTSNGALLSEENYSRGLRHGHFDFRDNNRDNLGQKLVDGEFDQGRPSGKWTWFPSGAAVARESAKPLPAGKWTWIPTHSMIVGQWRDGLPDGHWQWNDAEGQTYLSVDFDHGRVTSKNGGEFGPHLPKLLAKAAGDDPRLLVRLFAVVDLNFAEVPVKDTSLYLRELAQLPLRFDVRGLEMASVSVDAPITYKAKNIPLLIALDQMLKPYEVGCDYRYGMLCIDSLDSIANWKDKTGVTEFVPSRGSRLARELNNHTTLECVEMPFKDVALYLTETHGGAVRFDLSRLTPSSRKANAGLSPDTPVTLTLRSISLQNAIATILDSIGCKASLSGETIVVEPQ